MQTHFRWCGLRGASGLLAVWCSLSLAGQTAGAGNVAVLSPAPIQLAQLEKPAPGVHAAAAVKAPRATLANDSTEAGLLREAYARLYVADHDYKGHRVRAMRQIEAAAAILGVELKGDGKGHEPQATSDAQLRQARDLLGQITGAVVGTGLLRIQLAIEQLNLALAVR
jgi:hypothetical protein